MRWRNSFRRPVVYRGWLTTDARRNRYEPRNRPTFDDGERMLLQIDHHSGQPIYRQVIDQIRRQVVAGQLREGEQLPSVRDLAGQLRVNPMTISKAYSLLEMEGLLERRRGVGLFVVALRRDQAGRTKTEMLEEALTKAVVTAVQLEIPEDEARDMLAQLYRKYNSTE